MHDTVVPTPAGKPVVLLVEDEPLTAQYQLARLAELGYTVHHVENGERAVAVIIKAKLPIDIVLMDIDLGTGIDGTQAAKQILSQRELPIVFVSSQTDPEIVASTTPMSYGYVVKQSEPAVLDAVITTALRLFAERHPADEISRLLAATLDRMHTCVFMKDRSGHYTFANQTTLKLFNCSLPELIGSDDRRFFDPDTVEILRSIDQRVLSGQDTEEIIDTCSSDGTRRFYLELKTPIYAADGRITGLLGISTEITERIQAEQHLQTQLSEKELLLREVHHRLRNNMLQIESHLQLQSQDTKEPAVTDALQATASHIASIRTLYDSLLLDGEYQDVSIQQYFTQLIDAISAVHHPRTAISIEHRIADLRLPPKTAFYLGVILNELLTNIYKHAFPADDTTEQPRITVSIANTGNRHTLSVADNGIGKTSTAGSEGTSGGFGLQIIDILAEQLGGTSTTTIDQGRIVSVTFPV